MRKKFLKTLAAGFVCMVITAGILAGCSKEDSARQPETEITSEAESQTAEPYGSTEASGSADVHNKDGMTAVESMNLSDGEYQIAVSVEGGTGKVSVESPTVLSVKEGKAAAKIVWSSPNYDYMMVNGQKYTPVETTGEASVYEIPVEGFDWEMPVVADTVAMSTPHEIDYTLYFDSSSLE